MYTLGINSYSHDSAAALLRGGQLIAFCEEERLNRDKHTRAFPERAISECLAIAGIELSDVAVVAFGSRPDLDLLRNTRIALAYRPHLAHRLAWTLRHSKARWRRERDFVAGSRHARSGHQSRRPRPPKPQ